MKIAILGNGPAAAYAYRACIDSGETPVVFASGRPAYPSGAFWLHWLPGSIPDRMLKRAEIEITYVGLGNAELYSGKMWHETFDSSFPTISRVETGYVPEALNLLWDNFDDWTNSGILRDAGVEQLAHEYDLVLQTFPTDQSKRIQRSPVFFPIYSRPLLVSDKRVTCIYNGTLDEWVRMTIGFGAMHIEFPEDITPHPGLWPSHLWTVRKFPDMHPTTRPFTRGVARNVVLVGRHARWDRGLLSHAAYGQVTKVLKNRGEEEEQL